jgi:primosomal protein N' (replication factor Y)
MHYYEVAPNQIVRSDSNVFTYSYEAALKVGQLVVIEVGKKHLTGVVIKEVPAPDFKTKPITSVIEPEPLPSGLVKLALWLSDYYKTPLATVLQTVLPRGLSVKRRAARQAFEPVKRNRTNFLFNKYQSEAIDTISSSSPGTFLLQGVTGSGKTAIYIELAKRTIESGQSVIILVPEIALTTQVIAEFAHTFSDIIVTHSRASEAERHLAWRQALTATTPQLVIGPRSALFTPLKDLGLIVIDEAHEPSFKQEQAPRYSALRAATMLGRFSEAKVVFGSATPSVVDRYIAERAERPVLKLPERARQDAIPPAIDLVDMTKRSGFKRHRFLSDALLSSIEKNLAEHRQTLIFHNRRGSAATTLCDNCGWTALCPNCFVPLTLHSDSFKLSCHICGYNEAVPKACPVCSSVNIIHKGIGTKLIESELNKIFTQARIARFDSDTESDKSLDKLYDQLYRGEIDIAIGTQVVAKGLDLPHLRTVGVIQADSGLALPDYAASERAFQLLSQVIGRVGRNSQATNVIVQSYQPTHPSVVYGLAQDYESFYEQALAERAKAHFPPFVYLLKLTAVYKTEAGAVRASKDLAKQLAAKANPKVQILGPTPSFYERLHGTFRWQLVLKSPRREYLAELIEQLPPTNWQYELDPTSLL